MNLKTLLAHQFVLKALGAVSEEAGEHASRAEQHRMDCREI